MIATGSTMAEGRRRLDEGDRVGAEACFRQVTPDAVDFVSAMGALGQLLLADGRAAEAETVLRQALVKAPDAEVLLALGHSCWVQDRFADAAVAFQTLVRLEPRHARAVAMGALCDRAQGHRAEAIKGLERAVGLDPHFQAARFQLAMCLVESREFLRAGGQLHALLQQAPNFVAAIVLKGDLALAQNDPRLAVVSYCRALKIEPLEAAALKRLGDAMVSMGDEAQALRAYEEAIARDPAHWEAYLAAAKLAETAKGVYVARRYYMALAYEPRHAAAAQAGLERVKKLMAAHGLSEQAPPPARRVTAEFHVPTGILAPPIRRTPTGQLTAPSGPLSAPSGPLPGHGGPLKPPVERPAKRSTGNLQAPEAFDIDFADLVPGPPERGDVPGKTAVAGPPGPAVQRARGTGRLDGALAAPPARRSSFTLDPPGAAPQGRGTQPLDPLLGDKTATVELPPPSSVGLRDPNAPPPPAKGPPTGPLPGGPTGVSDGKRPATGLKDVFKGFFKGKDRDH